MGISFCNILDQFLSHFVLYLGLRYTLALVLHRLDCILVGSLAFRFNCIYYRPFSSCPELKTYEYQECILKHLPIM